HTDPDGSRMAATPATPANVARPVASAVTAIPIRHGTVGPGGRTRRAASVAATTAATPHAGHHGARPAAGATASPAPAATSPAAATPAPSPRRGACAGASRPRNRARSRTETTPAQIAAATVPGTSMVASNVPGSRCRPDITTRLVGLPWTTAIEKALATPIVASSSGRAAAPRAARTRITGTITTTAP